MSKFRAIVLGGTRSGKSRLAERLTISRGLSRVYIATAQAFDVEMQDRIAAHRDRRDDGWTTIEAALDLPAALGALRGDQVALVDCATLWLSNVMLAERAVAPACDALIEAIAACPAELIVVSNEVGSGIVPDTPLGRAFRDAQGALNQQLAASADLAVLAVAGLPMVLKGDLPGGLR